MTLQRRGELLRGRGASRSVEDREDPHGLGHDHVPRFLPRREPRGARRFVLAVRHGLQARAKHLAVVGGAVEREREQPRGEGRESHEHERQPEVDEEDLDQERRVAKDLDVRGVHLSNDGTRVYALAGESESSQRARLLLLDPASGATLARTDLFPGAVWGIAAVATRD